VPTRSSDSSTRLIELRAVGDHAVRAARCQRLAVFRQPVIGPVIGEVIHDREARADMGEDVFALKKSKIVEEFQRASEGVLCRLHAGFGFGHVAHRYAALFQEADRAGPLDAVIIPGIGHHQPRDETVGGAFIVCAPARAEIGEEGPCVIARDAVDQEEGAFVYPPALQTGRDDAGAGGDALSGDNHRQFRAAQVIRHGDGGQHIATT